MELVAQFSKGRHKMKQEEGELYQEKGAEEEVERLPIVVINATNLVTSHLNAQKMKMRDTEEPTLLKKQKKIQVRW